MPFDAGQAIGFGLSAVRARPRAAAILLAWDGATAAIVLLSLAYLASWELQPNTAGLVSILLGALAAMRHWVSAAAWLRFFAGRTGNLWLPFRISMDEVRLFVIGMLVIFVLVLSLAPVALVWGSGAPGAALLALIPASFALWLTAYLAPAGALTILRGDFGALDKRVIPGADRWLIAAAYGGVAFIVLAAYLIAASIMMATGQASDFASMGAWLDAVYSFELREPLEGAELFFVGLAGVIASLVWILWRGVSMQAAMFLDASDEASRPASLPAPDRAPGGV